MEKFDWAYITALISITFGWFLNEFGQWLRTRSEDKKIKREVLYNLLETYFIFNKMDSSEMVKLLNEKIILRFPEVAQNEELRIQFNQLISEYINSFIKVNVNESLGGIEKKYNSALDSLAKIDPVSAYRLNGKTKINEIFSHIEKYSENIKQDFLDDIDKVDKSIQNAEKIIKSDIIKEAIDDLEYEIRNIAFSISIITWYKSKKVLQRTRDRIKIDGSERIDKLLNQILPTNT